ncbi:unnamed protein product [Strongylus vulgaris]|uniref:Uncharacterized protein n=1 Tax=Strongylus vulgaris TaxID=40348 RepID=A0A3P7IL19_STRVU|nr:unnamed protein product [Strongylus vulgaris]
MRPLLHGRVYTALFTALSSSRSYALLARIPFDTHLVLSYQDHQRKSSGVNFSTICPNGGSFIKMDKYGTWLAVSMVSFGGRCPALLHIQGEDVERAATGSAYSLTGCATICHYFFMILFSDSF